MQYLKLILRNALRHKLRTGLTVLGLVVAILAFGLLQTVVDAWYAGAENAAPNRLVTRNAISLTFSMPLHYRDKIRAVDGVRAVGAANWFGGIYQDPKNQFAQFAVEVPTFVKLFPEVDMPADQVAAWQAERTSCVVGGKLAAKFGWKIGDTVPIQGTIYPGEYRFVVRGIYKGKTADVDENTRDPDR
jgi:putative ABC transport system permease protein